MSPEIYRTKSVYEQTRDYAGDLSAILSRELTPEAIETYADGALQDLISLVDDACQDYGSQPTVGFEAKKDLEDATCRYFNLDDLETILDHVADKADEIRHLDVVIEKAKVIDQIIMPPDPAETQIKTGNGGFEETRQIPRLKTVLFILSNEFGLDVQDPDQVTICRGVMNGSTVRRISYFVVEAKAIGKTVLVCDEEGNVTYVLDSVKLEEAKIEDIESLTKKELNELIKSNPAFGQRIIYNDYFITRMVRLFHSENFAQESEEQGKVIEGQEDAQFLKPKVKKAPEDYRSIRGIALELDVAPQTVSDTINKLRNIIGQPEDLRFFNFTTKGYSPEQCKMITDYLKDNGLLAPRPPAGYMSKAQIAKEFHVCVSKIRSAIDELGVEVLGLREEYKFRGNIAEGFSPEQKDQIKRYLEEKNDYIGRAPEDYVSLSKLAVDMNVSRQTIQIVIGELGEEVFGSSKKYIFYNKVAYGYSPEQCRLIKIHLERQRGMSGGYVPVASIARELEVAAKTVRRLARDIGREKLGILMKVRFPNGIGYGYSSAQVQMIRERFVEEGQYIKAPQGYKTIGGIATELQVAPSTVSNIIEKLIKEDLGMPKRVKFNNGVYEGYSPQQFEQIKLELEKRQQK